MVHTTHPISAHRIWKVRLRILRLLVTSNPFLHLCMGSELSEAIHAFRMRRPVGKLGFPYSSVSLKTDSHLRDQQDKREWKSSSIEDVSFEFPNRHSHTEQRDCTEGHVRKSVWPSPECHRELKLKTAFWLYGTFMEFLPSARVPLFLNFNDFLVSRY